MPNYGFNHIHTHIVYPILWNFHDIECDPTFPSIIFNYMKIFDIFRLSEKCLWKWQAPFIYEWYAWFYKANKILCSHRLTFWAEYFHQINHISSSLAETPNRLCFCHKLRRCYRRHWRILQLAIYFNSSLFTRKITRVIHSQKYRRWLNFNAHVNTTKKHHRIPTNKNIHRKKII